MKKRLVAGLVLQMALFLGVSAWAAPVGTNDAARAVRAWVRRGGALGARLGTGVASVSVQTTTNGLSFYAVATRGGGTVFTSADDTLEPILAFTSDPTAAEAARDPRSPLHALLSRDVIGRTAAQEQNAAPRLTTSSARKANPKWAALLAESRRLTTSAATPPHVESVGDLRVPPLVQTKWDQTTDLQGNYCYNYYTPNHYYSGCAATAMAQIMRYHRWPTASCTSVTNVCWVDDVPVEAPTLGGVYAWANMPLEPRGKDGATMTEGQCKAIGKLCYDAGVAVRMNWGKSVSGTFSALAGEAFRDVFGYGSAYGSEGREKSGDEAGIAAKVLSNLGAGYPVMFGICYRYYTPEGKEVAQNGHAIVGDGYGYNDDTLYVHLNMGWSGSDDVWYQLPDMGTTSEQKAAFNSVDDIVYNIIPDGSDSKAVISGRVTVPTGAPASFAKVAIYGADKSTPVTNVMANAYGVYGVVLPAGGKYEVQASLNQLEGSTNMVAALSAPQGASYTFSGYVGTNKVSYTTTKYVKLNAEPGNAMGVDVKITGEPSVGELVWTGPTSLVATQFVALAHTFTALGGDPPLAWSAPKGLPAGLVLDSVTGALSGAPEQAGDQSFDVTVTDAFGSALTTNITLTVQEPEAPKPVIDSIEGRPATGAMRLGVGEEATFTIYFHDPAGDAMTLKVYESDGYETTVTAPASTWTYAYPHTFAKQKKDSYTIRVTLSNSTWEEAVSDQWDVYVGVAPPGAEIAVPSGKTAAEFAATVNANKADYLKAPGGVATTDDYLDCFTAVPSGDSAVVFVLNDAGTNAVGKASAAAGAQALGAVQSGAKSVTITSPLAGFFYSLKQGGSLSSLGFQFDTDRNRLAGKDALSFSLDKPEGAGFYQTLVTPTEYNQK